MGVFRDSINGKTSLGVTAPVSADDVMSFWYDFLANNDKIFNLYERHLQEQSLTDEANDPCAMYETSQRPLQPGMLDLRRQNLENGLDLYADRAFQYAEAQRIGEKNAIFTHRQNAQPTETTVVTNAPQCTVRVQVQRNFSATGSDTLAALAIDNPGGVTVIELEAAYLQVKTDSGLNGKFLTYMDQAWDAHKRNWLNYGVGGSHSVNFDNNKIVTKGRPKSGYRLDIENVRQAPGKRNFI